MFEDTPLSALLDVVGVVAVGCLVLLGVLGAWLPSSLPTDRVGWGLMAVFFALLPADRLLADRRGEAVGWAVFAAPFLARALGWRATGTVADAVAVGCVAVGLAVAFGVQIVRNVRENRAESPS